MPRVPSRSHYDPVSDCHFHTGADAVEWGSRYKGSAHLAVDTETPAVDRNFEIRCVTMAWDLQGETHTILLDAVRDEEHNRLARQMLDRASTIILHNAPFDVPGLYHHGLLTRASIGKIVDTLVLAKFGFPDPITPHSLGAMAMRYLGWEDTAAGMKVAFKAAGYKTIAAGFAGMDIDSPIYRQGAMLDTVAALRIHPLLREHCWAYAQNHPYEVLGATNLGEAEALLETQETVHRMGLWATAKGIPVDGRYMDNYSDRVDRERVRAVAELATVGLEGGAGKGAKLVNYLQDNGFLPAGWPRTPKGALSSAKEHLEALDHPLAVAQRTIAEIDKVKGYIEKVEIQARVTGRCHPQMGTLGASATGRMSYSSPPLQQFNADARSVLASGGEFAADQAKVWFDEKGKIHTECVGPETQLWSIDWSQIEPITMGILAQDEQFLAPYESGEDLYEPLMRASGIDRPTAKVVLLADMYGQGEKSMAARINKGLEQAQQIRRQMRSAMPRCTRWMAKVQTLANEYGVVVTAGGRILPVDKGGVFRAVNYVVQGSAYDVLAHTMVEMHRAGMDDLFRIAMHDELVLDCTEAESKEVQQIMQTPPPFFEYYLGRPPVIRTDRAAMGASWLKI